MRWIHGACSSSGRGDGPGRQTDHLLILRVAQDLHPAVGQQFLAEVLSPGGEEVEGVGFVVDGADVAHLGPPSRPTVAKASTPTYSSFFRQVAASMAIPPLGIQGCGGSNPRKDPARFPGLGGGVGVSRPGIPQQDLADGIMVPGDGPLGQNLPGHRGPRKRPTPGRCSTSRSPARRRRASCSPRPPRSPPPRRGSPWGQSRSPRWGRRRRGR